jgi:hypothetical protein
VSLNAVDDVDAFLSDVAAGRWDAVLPQVAHLRLPTAKLFNLYEQVRSHPPQHARARFMTCGSDACLHHPPLIMNRIDLGCACTWLERLPALSSQLCLVHLRCWRL